MHSGCFQVFLFGNKKGLCLKLFVSVWPVPFTVRRAWGHSEKRRGKSCVSASAMGMAIPIPPPWTLSRSESQRPYTQRYTNKWEHNTVQSMVQLYIVPKPKVNAAHFYILWQPCSLSWFSEDACWRLILSRKVTFLLFSSFLGVSSVKTAGKWEKTYCRIDVSHQTFFSSWRDKLPFFCFVLFCFAFVFVLFSVFFSGGAVY